MQCITPHYSRDGWSAMWSGRRIIEHVFDPTRPRRPPLRAGAPGLAPRRQRSASGAGAVGGPPGWPPGVRRRERGWDHRPSAWLLDHCPPDYRLYPAWRRHPVALAWFTVRHLDAQLDAMRSAYREVRVDLVDDIGPEGVAQVLADLECEGVRLLSAAGRPACCSTRSAGLDFVPMPVTPRRQIARRRGDLVMPRSGAAPASRSVGGLRAGARSGA